ncbi:MAG TPA: radical SAM protein [Methylocystis sp.]|nr:radical SAM protein [Methylocystis sp.]
MDCASHLKILPSTTGEQIRDTSRPVVLIGFQRHSNLGLGYLAATLASRGYEVKIFDFEVERHKILKAVKALDPVLVGFSLIFQSYVNWFGALARYLRDNGVVCHFVIGGHFPSLSHERTFALIPELDSVVRFEGEETLLELADRLSTDRDWRALEGLSYKDGETIVATPLRPLIKDLDALPYPIRTFEKNTILGRNATPILASRGCARTCSFCSIHMFYRTAPGKVVRTRKPEEVAREMRYLFEEHDITIFLFQDDDFPLYGAVWRQWAHNFLAELHRNDLPGRVVWKINCRADAVEPDLFREMKAAGLYLVYMGLESGSEEGLRTLHKQITVEQNLRAVRILKETGVIFEFGFMLLDPSSSFESVRENLDFLRAIVGDGSAGASFGRMAPYDGTPIKDELEKSGRLRGDVCKPDYDFLDPKLTRFYREILTIVEATGWTHASNALTLQLNFAWNEAALIELLAPRVPGLSAYKDRLREITSDSNNALIQAIEDTSYAVCEGRPRRWSLTSLRAQCENFADRLETHRRAYILRNQDLLLSTLRREGRAAC